MDGIYSSLGLIEVVGYATAMAAADGAMKCANVRFVGMERVIGAGESVTLVVKLTGEVAAVAAAVEAGVHAAGLVGKVFASRVLARPDESVSKIVLGTETGQAND